MVEKKVIDIKGLSVSYDRKRVLTNIHLKIMSHGLYGIMGPNGAGKSTLFKSILGLIEINAGKIEVLDKQIKEVQKKVVYVPQKSDVDWSFPATVFDIVLMGRYPHKSIFQRIDRQDRQIAENAINEMGIAALKDRQIGELSGGQQQRVFLARALCQGAEIFLLDEPFVGVDITTEEKIILKLQELAKAGKTILVIHHDLSTASKYFNRLIFINQRLVAFGNTEQVLTKENIANTYTGELPILHQIGLLN